MRPIALCLITVMCLVSSCGGGASEGMDALEDFTPNLAQASRNYIMKCSVCHGADGAPVLLTAPDLRTSTLGLEERVAIIAHGKGTMPPHQAMLSKAEILDLALYIEEFRP